MPARTVLARPLLAGSGGRKRRSRRPRGRLARRVWPPTPTRVEVAPQHVRPVRGARPEGSVRKSHGRRVGHVLAQRLRTRAPRPAARSRDRRLPRRGRGRARPPSTARAPCATASSRASRASGGSPLVGPRGRQHLRQREATRRPVRRCVMSVVPSPGTRSSLARARGARRRRTRSPRRRAGDRSRSWPAPAP